MIKRSQKRKRLDFNHISFVLLILYILLTIESADKVLMGLADFNVTSFLKFIYFLAIAAAECLCFLGFFKKSPKAWYGTMALIVLAVLKPFFIALLGNITFDRAALEVGDISIVFILVGIYYIVQRPLFFNSAEKSPTSEPMKSIYSLYQNIAQSLNKKPLHYDNSQINTSAHNSPDDNPTQKVDSYERAAFVSNSGNVSFGTKEILLNGAPLKPKKGSQKQGCCKHCGKPLSERDIEVCLCCGTKIRKIHF